ncbi:MAG: hypothetical protein RQ875_08900 [Vicingaceae bacterium]|nr:hypothetical protein [Vicingaceae bacterium]
MAMLVKNASYYKKIIHFHGYIWTLNNFNVNLSNITPISPLASYLYSEIKRGADGKYYMPNMGEPALQIQTFNGSNASASLTAGAAYQLTGSMPTQVFKFFANNGGTAEGNRRIGNKHYELNDHLGSVRVVISDLKQLNNQGDLTTIDANDYFSPSVLSFSDTYPFGMSMRDFNPNEARYSFNGQEKDLDINEGGNSYTAEFWQYDSRTARRWNMDIKPNISTSSYSTFSNNPILYIDLKGDTSEFFGIKSGKLLGTFNDEGPLRRIKIDEELFNGAVASASGQVGRRVLQERDNFIANHIISTGVLSEILTGTNSLIAFETGNYSLNFTGAVLPKNLITFPKKLSSNNADYGILGFMTLNTIFDDGSSIPVETYNITSGPYENGPTPNNQYIVRYGKTVGIDGISRDNWVSSTSEPGMKLNSGANGWKLRLPPFNGRGGLLIHPDCNDRGTAGCIGVRESDGALLKLGNFFDNYIRVQRRTLIVNFQINGNPNYGNQGNSTSGGSGQ